VLLVVGDLRNCPDGGLGVAKDGHSRAAQRMCRRLLPVHRLHDSGLACFCDGACQTASGVRLGLAQLIGRRAVAAEVARQQDRVDLIRLEQDARNALVRLEILLACACEVDGVRGHRGRRHHRAEASL
jgi:hypothetical protein